MMPTYKNRPALFALAVAALLALWMASGLFFPARDEATEAGQEAALPKVQVVDSVAQEVAPNVTMTGRTVPSAQVQVQAEVDGRVEALPVEEGDAVKAGDLLAQIEARDRAERVAEAERRRAQRAMEFKAAQGLAGRGFASDVRLAETRANLEAARAAEAAARLALAKTQVAAPFSGVVAERFVDAGAYVTPGQALFDLVALDPLEVEGYASEQQVGHLEAGQAATVRLLDGREVSGRLAFIAPVAGETARTFRVKVRVPNPAHAVRAGRTATLAFSGTPEPAHKISPAALTLDDAGTLGVRIVGGGDVVGFAPVAVVREEADAAWVSGLPARARIIVVGQEFVAAGEKVAVQTIGAEATPATAANGPPLTEEGQNPAPGP
ncbi:MAG TPA: hypothetical protein DDX54_06780 [Rhodospirillaceae bacterium]|jgi:multidrug efflux system membrane fusion protein|nr:efflux RND transporter periplasmic adaptor subunit [Alphaproteobacteria bacterium]HBH27088.1 hypothetical protein [Rhodospirillaceae bacterium]